MIPLKYLDLLKLIDEKKITPFIFALYVTSMAKILNIYLDDKSFYKTFVEEIKEIKKIDEQE
jgi:hypothetical protein